MYGIKTMTFYSHSHSRLSLKYIPKLQPGNYIFTQIYDKEGILEPPNLEVVKVESSPKHRVQVRCFQNAHEVVHFIYNAKNCDHPNLAYKIWFYNW